MSVRIPSNQIVKSKYTIGKEYMFESTYREYQGYYYELNGKLFAGNMTLPSMFSVKLSNAKMELVTEKSQSKLDEYCFILRGELNKLEFYLIPNKKFPLDP